MAIGGDLAFKREILPSCQIKDINFNLPIVYLDFFYVETFMIAEQYVFYEI
jgi:hypothetical protein